MFPSLTKCKSLYYYVQQMLFNLDYNHDGQVNSLDLAGYLVNLCGPYVIIFASIFAPNLESDLRLTLVTMGAAMAGTAHKQEKREEMSDRLIDATVNAAVDRVTNNLNNSTYNEVPSYTDSSDYPKYDGTAEIDLEEIGFEDNYDDSVTDTQSKITWS